MSPDSWLQIGFYLAVLLLLARPLGSYMARIYQAEHTLLDPLLGPIERLLYRLSGVKPDEDMDWKTYAIALMLFNGLGLLAVYGLQRLQPYLPLNPQGLQRCDSRLVVEHSCQLCHKHELAGLRRRGHDELPVTNARSDRAELCLGRDGHGRVGRAHPGHRAAHGHGHWQLLGGSDAHHPLHPAAAGDDRRRRHSLAGRCTDPQPVQDRGLAGTDHRCEWKRRYTAGFGCRAGGFADRHQAIGDKRRRILQRQLGASLRKPNSVFELCRDAFHPADLRSALPHVWQDGRRHPPRMGSACSHDRHLRSPSGAGGLG